MHSSTPNHQAIDLLNALLRGELAAVVAYDQTIAVTAGAVPELEENRTSHLAQAAVLRSRITALKAIPAATSGAWGALAMVMPGETAPLSRGAALSALQAGEDHGLVDYYQTLSQLDPVSREMVECVVLPAQKRMQQRVPRHCGVILLRLRLTIRVNDLGFDGRR